MMSPGDFVIANCPVLLYADPRLSELELPFGIPPDVGTPATVIAVLSHDYDSVGYERVCFVLLCGNIGWTSTCWFDPA